MPKHSNDPNYILNPRTNRYVKRNGRIGKALTQPPTLKRRVKGLPEDLKTKIFSFIHRDETKHFFTPRQIKKKLMERIDQLREDKYAKAMRMKTISSRTKFVRENNSYADLYMWIETNTSLHPSMKRAVLNYFFKQLIPPTWEMSRQDLGEMLSWKLIKKDRYAFLPLIDYYFPQVGGPMISLKDLYYKLVNLYNQGRMDRKDVRKSLEFYYYLKYIDPPLDINRIGEDRFTFNGETNTSKVFEYRYDDYRKGNNKYVPNAPNMDKWMKKFFDVPITGWLIGHTYNL